MTPEIPRILNQLRQAFDGDAWSGPSLQATLAGTTAAQAAAHPLAGTHSIGEIVRHLTTWADIVAQRIEQRALVPLVAPDWPEFAAEPNETAWQQAMQALQQAHEHLLAVAAALPETDLDILLGDARQRADGSGVSVYVLLHGTAQHYLYHAGQIALLRKFV
jgi:uncharacterized damage-inducible protein DinB